MRGGGGGGSTRLGGAEAATLALDEAADGGLQVGAVWAAVEEEKVEGGAGAVGEGAVGV